jgi:diaminopimelate epimerase
VRVEKWQALGNAYLVAERSDTGRLDRARVQRLCDPAVGPGADGVLEIVERDHASATVAIWNPDGSVAEMSGNGVRIAACWLARRTGAGVVTITAPGGSVAVELLGGGLARSTMGPVTVGDDEDIDAVEPLRFAPASVGNPHAVIRRDAATRDDLLRIGPHVERHPRFPERTNVQLVEPLGRHDLRVLVWERGVGETSSSGSSSVAAAAVAVARGWCESPVTVHLPGGALEVALDGPYAVLTGPAELVGTADVTAALRPRSRTRGARR